MTAVADFVDISAGHAVPHDVEHHAVIGLRETLGTVYVDADFPALFAEARHRNPGIVTLGYPFLTGPGRTATVAQQIAYWAVHHRCDLGALDWERDVYRVAGVEHDEGIQSFYLVLRGLDIAREKGIDAGLYGSRYLFSPAVVEALIARKTPFLWIAAYGKDNGPIGPEAIPQWIVKACQAAGIMLIHQYAGATLDWNRVLVGTLEQIHALAGRPPASGPAHSTGDAMFTLARATTHQDAVLRKGAQMFEDSALTKPHSHPLPAETPLALAGEGAKFTVVVDAGQTVYVAVADVLRRVPNDREFI